MADEFRNWSRDTEELAACFTIHARDLFGDACVLSDADRAMADDLVQGAFEAASTVWSTLRDLPADQCHDWLLDTLAAAAQDRTGHPDRAFVSPAHRRITGPKTARFRADYDAGAGLDRFAGWLLTRPAGNEDSSGLDGAPGRPARPGDRHRRQRHPPERHPRQRRHSQRQHGQRRIRFRPGQQRQRP